MTTKRNRRTDEQLISDLEAEIQRLKHRAAQRQVTRSPAIRHTTNALKAIDTAMSLSDDAVLRRALDDARATLVACLAVQGVNVPASNGKARRGTSAVDANALLAHIQQHAGQRGEEIAAALGTDTTTMRPVMRRLIAENKVKTRGERRGMQYFAA
jgi:hypothetical protein